MAHTAPAPAHGPAPAPAAAVESSEGGFAKALLMIALLPLSDAEKADAVRRLMADQATGPVCGR